MKVKWAYCKYCGARLKRDPVGQFCPSKNCQWHHGLLEGEDTLTKMGKPVKRKQLKQLKIKMDDLKEKMAVLRELQILRQRMFEDMVNWTALYNASGTREYLQKHHEEFWTVEDILGDKFHLKDIDYHIDYIQKYLPSKE